MVAAASNNLAPRSPPLPRPPPLFRPAPSRFLRLQPHVSDCCCGVCACVPSVVCLCIRLGLVAWRLFWCLLGLAGEALEYATFLSTKAADTRTFELHIAQVKAYYRDFKYAWAAVRVPG